MIHMGKNNALDHRLKGISAGRGQNTYRGLVKILKAPTTLATTRKCDSMLIGDRCGAHTFPYIDVRNSTATMEHEASTSKIGEDQIFYAKQRGLSAEDAVSMIVNGFCKEESSRSCRWSSPSKRSGCSASVSRGAWVEQASAAAGQEPPRVGRGT